METTSNSDWFQAKILGNGSFGIVSLWKDKKTGDKLAIKICKMNLISNLTKRQIERWELEVSIMKNIIHKNIVAFRDLSPVLTQQLLKHNPTGLPVMSMEYCEKGNLRTQLNKIENSCGLIEQETREILQDISQALKYLHTKRITHRDVKPENIVLQLYNHRRSATIYKLIDLGYAKEIQGTASFVGTLQYLAPEIFYNAKYNQVVDYWSFGITTFEIACGTRPFNIPNMTPFESFQNLRNKDSNNIYMYRKDNNEICFSNEILRENFISQCFKQNLENWLRTVLEFNPNKRGNLYPNRDVFSGLQEILAKKIIIIFSMYTYEFYSYEIEDSTILSTVQDWIARDIKVPKTEQFLISNNKISVQTDQFAVSYYSQDCDTMLYVFKKDISVNKNFYHKLPKYVRTLIEDANKIYRYNDLKNLYEKALYYVSKEIKHMQTFEKGMRGLNEKLLQTFSQAKGLLFHAKQTVSKLLHRIDFCRDFEKSLKDNGLFSNKRLEANLRDYEDLLKKANECVRLYRIYFGRNLDVTNHVRSLEGIFGNIEKCFEDCDMSSSNEEILFRIKTMEQNESKVDPKIVKALAGVLKMRDKLLRISNINDFIRFVVKCLSKIEKFNTALKCFIQDVTNICDSMERNKVLRIRIVYENKNGAIFTPSPFVFQNRNLQLDSEKILEENEYWRYKFEEFINTSLQDYKEIRLKENFNF